MTWNISPAILVRGPRTANPEIRRRLLAAGQDLIYVQGFAAVGVAEFAAAGIPKGSFYNYFETKEQYGAEVAAAYWDDIETAYGPILGDPGLSRWPGSPATSGR